MKKLYKVTIYGCDDITRFTVQLTKKELELVKRLAKLSEDNSSWSCQPTLTVEEND